MVSVSAFYRRLPVLVIFCVYSGVVVRLLKLQITDFFPLTCFHPLTCVKVTKGSRYFSASLSYTNASNYFSLRNGCSVN